MEQIISGHLTFDPASHLEEASREKHFIRHSEQDRKFKYFALQGEQRDKKRTDFLSNEIPALKLSKSAKFDKAMKTILNSQESDIQMLRKIRIHNI